MRLCPKQTKPSYCKNIFVAKHLLRGSYYVVMFKHVRQAPGKYHSSQVISSYRIKNLSGEHSTATMSQVSCLSHLCPLC